MATATQEQIVRLAPFQEEFLADIFESAKALTGPGSQMPFAEQQLEGLSEGQQMGVQDINTLLGIGSLQQQQGQRQLDIDRANTLAELALPYQQIGFMSDIFRGVPALQQTFSRTTTPPPSTSSQLFGLAQAGLGAYGLMNQGRGFPFGGRA